MSELEARIIDGAKAKAVFTAGEVERGNDLPTLAEQRHKEALEKAKAVFAAAREVVSSGMMVAVGYRVMVKPIESTLNLEEAEKEAAPTLASADFQVKSDAQKQREAKGENHGVIINLGATAFDRLGGRESWCDVGDVVVFSRYAGTSVEHPPGSGNMYQLMNDEDVFGKVI